MLLGVRPGLLPPVCRAVIIFAQLGRLCACCKVRVALLLLVVVVVVVVQHHH